MSIVSICIECGDEYDEQKSNAEVPMDFCSSLCESAYEAGPDYEDEEDEDWDD